ncbi:hypothetical protein [Planococcus versutus]|uniref:hypothetical protein n=1 Tax=Planococcus versutus TaxID=1302659 RepID=UPI000A63DC62|nr:hypothetical protein [Planococcus versutus]
MGRNILDGQAIGAEFVIGRAALWGASKLTGLVARNWDNISKGIKNFGSSIANKVRDG